MTTDMAGNRWQDSACATLGASGQEGPGHKPKVRPCLRYVWTLDKKTFNTYDPIENLRLPFAFPGHIRPKRIEVPR